MKEDKWTQEQILYEDNGFPKTFSTPCIPKRWCYGFTAVVDVVTVYVKNVSLICRYISLWLNFNSFYYYTFGSLIEDFLQCHKIENNFLLRLSGFNSAKYFFQYRRNLTNFAVRLIWKSKTWRMYLTLKN